MAEFPNIKRSWDFIFTRPVKCEEDYDRFSSFRGRAICLLHTLAIPIKAFSALGKLTLSVIAIATIIFGVITFNESPNKLWQAGANVIDVKVGSALLPLALAVSVVRGVIGIVFPSAMIVQTFARSWERDHYLLSGIVVNY